MNQANVQCKNSKVFEVICLFNFQWSRIYHLYSVFCNSEIFLHVYFSRLLFEAHFLLQIKVTKIGKTSPSNPTFFTRLSLPFGKTRGNTEFPCAKITSRLRLIHYSQGEVETLLHLKHQDFLFNKVSLKIPEYVSFSFIYMLRVSLP